MDVLEARLTVSFGIYAATRRHVRAHGTFERDKVLNLDFQSSIRKGGSYRMRAMDPIRTRNWNAFSRLIMAKQDRHL